MSQQTMNPEETTTDPVLQRIYSHFNEEKVVKDFSAVQLSRLKTLDELTEEIRNSKNYAGIREVLEENLRDAPESIVSRYVLGQLDLAGEDPNGILPLRSLLEDFQKISRWPIVDHISDVILNFDENNRTALRAKVESTGRLRGKKELKPYLARLAAIDKKNPDIAKQYALSILEEDRPQALQFLKSAGETYARQKDYRHLEEIWGLLIQHDHNDLPFFERIERILVADREKTRIAAYLQSLVEPFKVEENWNSVIAVLKKILEYEPGSTRARSDLVRAYKARYADHSLLSEFLKMSDLLNNKKTVGPCIANFERNIVFDKGNYVHHRTRGVGKILSIESDHMIIDFRENPGQKMSIQMAISSLQPLEPDHIWVQYYENPEDMKELFEADILLFFETMLKSFNNSMAVSDVKAEISDRFIPASEWSKWWSKTRTKLKNSPRFGFNPHKKDELILHEVEVEHSEEMIIRFQSITDWNQKLTLAYDALKDKEADVEKAIDVYARFYKEQEDNKDALKKIHSYLFLKTAVENFGDEDIPLPEKQEEVENLIKEQPIKTLIKQCKDTPVLDLKRDFVSLIVKLRPDYSEILGEILFEVPRKVNGFVLNELNRKGQTETLQKFIKKLFSRYREHPEIFLWAAKSILGGQWNFPWIEASREEVILLVFRLLKPLVSVEKKGTKLKNQALDTIFGTTNITVESIKKSDLPAILQDSDNSTLRRMSALFREVPFVPDAQKENFVAFLEEFRPGFSESEGADLLEEKEDAEESLFPPADIVLVSPAGLEQRKAYLDRLINVDMPQNSKDIGEAQEKGDLRENAEYKAAMERQSQLQAEIKKIDADLKKARLIDGNIATDIVRIGSQVHVESEEGQKSYTILGPWEADTEKNIISYMSPLGKSLIGKKPGDTITLESGKSYRIDTIERGL